MLCTFTRPYLYSGALLEYLCMIYSKKKQTYLSYTGSLCSPSVQPLSETGSCLFKARLLMSPLCSDWSASGSFRWLQRLCQQTMKQTIVAGFHFFFSFFTPNVNFSNTNWVTCSFIMNSLVTLVCLETAPKTNNSDHVSSLQRVVLCNADATEHVQERCSVYSFTSFYISQPLCTILLFSQRNWCWQ